MEDYIDNILVENLTLKRKLESKCEAISILNCEVEKLMTELDRKKEIITKLKAKELCFSVEKETYHYGDSTRALKMEIDVLRQKLRDALGDVQALRSQTLEKSVYQPEPKSKSSVEEDLVVQLEILQKSKMQLEYDLQAILDEKEELITERDAYKCKLHRLNHECNVLLKGDTNGLIDLDALILENRLLQERVIQYQEECSLAKQVSERYKSLLHTKKNESNGKDDTTILTQKQAKKILDDAGVLSSSKEASQGELHSMCVALLDSLGDKSLALAHQKRANRILAARVAEIQARLQASNPQPIPESPSQVLLDGYKGLVPERDASGKMKNLVTTTTTELKLCVPTTGN